MSYPTNIERNRELVRKRKSNPEKWTYSALANHYKVSRPRALAIFREFGGVNELSPKVIKKSLDRG